MGGYVSKGTVEDASEKKRIQALVLQKYEELGPLTFQEKAVCVFFAVLINMWLWRDPKFIRGWGSLFTRWLFSDS